MKDVCLAGGAIADERSAITFNFNSDKPGDPPKGFEFARTGQSADGKWVVRADKESPTNLVLVQESTDPTDDRFPIAVVKEGSYKDVTLSVRAKPISGEVDQGFGLVWRYKDASNYYITRCNADEDNCTIYHTVKGSRRAFLNKSIKVAKNTWHTLKLDASGNHFAVWFDENKGSRRDRRHFQGCRPRGSAPERAREHPYRDWAAAMLSRPRRVPYNPFGTQL